ncbi:hypothetical protein FOXG_21650 [Fusarium oxysporum f. sp. lycopersici 4287]|uniref:BTB domain-containing protein n=1 Tax=Fusarium oxysporum f. sp. lycopersici (strain 4287 / CBS 123668 / FGSC 9935 / NRRL 34936) TaxID=426428 RepID=A0A0J9W0P8_FUSO4|nr:hypothetical protein FOXG_21650 [Fusarium oxysporum f. sp. lycopersici 4287]KAJ9414886.1 hypothetical protein QL093DRAFT_2625952 [Fusarium oxysporum]KNB16375.1 hypothetical protein FOXG_21650 [Fusarium oxysporum f. sp. lycopersici 4287]
MEFQPFEQLLKTRPQKFVVGPNRVEYYVQPTLFFCSSTPLENLIHEAEATKGSVTWTDVDNHIFARFVQFLYTGAYADFNTTDTTANTFKTPLDRRSPEELSKLFYKQTPGLQWGRKEGDDTSKLPYSLTTYSAAVKLCNPVCSLDLSRQHSSKRKFDTMASDSESLHHYPKRKEDFIQQFMNCYGVSANVGSVFNVQHDTQPTGSANEAILRDSVFIGHARMFIFAHRYEITSLVKHACTNLAQELSHWEVSVSAFVPVFAGLVHYIYNHAGSETSELQRLIARFAACAVEDVSSLQGWSSLLNEVPAFAADLIDEVTVRLR